MRAELVLEVRHDIVVVEVEARAGRLPAVYGVDDEQLLRARHVLRELDAERAAVDDLHRLGEVVVRIEVFCDAHAEALVAQDDIADAEDRDLSRMEHIIHARVHRAVIAKYICHVISPSSASPRRGPSATGTRHRVPGPSCTRPR